MTTNISNNLISQLKPSTQQYDVRDGRLKGFMVRVNPSGKMNYICEYKRGKRIYLGAVGVLSPNQARDMAKKVLGDAAQGIAPNITKKESQIIKLKEFIDEKYKPWAEAHRKAGADAVARIKSVFTNHSEITHSITLPRLQSINGGQTNLKQVVQLKQLIETSQRLKPPFQKP